MLTSTFFHFVVVLTVVASAQAIPHAAVPRILPTHSLYYPHEPITVTLTEVNNNHRSCRCDLRIGDDDILIPIQHCSSVVTIPVNHTTSFLSITSLTIRLQLTACGTGVKTFTNNVILWIAPFRNKNVVRVVNTNNLRFETDGLPFVPFGPYVYGVTTEQERSVPSDEVVYGMNMVTPYLSSSTGHDNATYGLILSFLDKCSSLGVRVHYALNALGPLPNTPTKFNLIKQEMDIVKNHPAVLAWYIADEPDGAGTPVEYIQQTYTFVKQQDPYHPVSMVFCCGGSTTYAPYADVIMGDPYPIPSGNPNSVLANTQVMMSYGKPVIMVPQAFGGGEWWERTPSAQETRLMVYLMIIGGATGIQPFVRSPPSGFPYAPNQWIEFRRLALEVAELTTALTGTPLTTVQSTSSITYRSWRDPNGTLYCVAANQLNTVNQATIPCFPTTLSGNAELLFQNAIVPITSGNVAVTLLGYGTVAFRFSNMTSAVNPNNIRQNPSYEQSFNVGSPDGHYIGYSGTNLSYATVFTDTRISIDGLHSIRITTPNNGGYLNFASAPISITAGQYVFSFYTLAMPTTANNAKPPVFVVQFGGGLTCATGGTSNVLTINVPMTGVWSYYEVSCNAQSSNTHMQGWATYMLTTPGTVWVDLMQLVPQ